MNHNELQAVLDNARLLYDEEQIAEAIARMAERINERLAGTLPLVFCVMNGGVIFTGHLAPKLRFPLQLEYLHATRYREQLSGADLQWRVKPTIPLAGRTVLILDDIFDEGETLAQIHAWCREQGATEVLTAVLVDKQHDRKTASLQSADFTALYADDKYLFGYGMDYKGYLRNAPGIYAVES